MPRRDDEFEDDDRPRRRPRGDEDDFDRPARPRGRREDDDFDRRPPSRRKSNLGLILGIIGGVLFLCCGGIGLLAYLFWDRVGGVVRDQQASHNNLAQIGLAIHQHHDRNGSLPNNSYDPTGKPLLSWRVHLLPFLGEDALYREFKLNEPWDSPANRPLLARMPKVYGTPKAGAAGEGMTYYRGFSHPGAIFEKPRGPGQVNRLTFNSILDGTTNTIAVVEAGQPVEWTRPDDLDWQPGRQRPLLGGPTQELPTCLVLMLDGSVRRMRKDVDDQTLRNLIDYKDGMVIPPGWEQ